MIPDEFIMDQDGADALEEGFYLLTMSRSERVDVPVAIWFAPPPDAEHPNSEGVPPRFMPTLDRSPRWMVEVNGVLIGDPDAPACIAGRPIEFLDEIWPRCARDQIDERDYRYRVDRALHAEQFDAADPFGGTGRKVDPLTATLPDYAQ